jgi:hypothetical protein
VNRFTHQSAVLARRDNQTTGTTTQHATGRVCDPPTS